MIDTTAAQNTDLREQIEESFRRALAHQDRLQRAERRLGTAQTTLTGMSGLTAGLATATNHPAAAPILACGATATTAVQKQRSDPELLAHVTECVGKLRALRVEAVVLAPAALGEQDRRLLAESDRVEY